jgi:hypothetical protein
MSEKNSKNVSTDGLFEMLGVVLMMLAAVGFFLLSALTLALGARGRRERGAGKEWLEVLLSKLSVAASVLVIFVGGVLFLDYRLPASFSLHDLSHTRELLFSSNPPFVNGKMERSIKEKQEQIKSEEFNFNYTQKEVERVADSKERAQRWLARADQWSRESAKRSLDYEQDRLLNAVKEHQKNIAKKERLEGELSLLNKNLEQEKQKEVNERQRSFTQRIFFSGSSERQKRWLFWVLLLVVFSVALSYPLEMFMEEENKKNNKLLSLGKGLDYLLSFLPLTLGFPFRRLMTLMGLDIEVKGDPNKRQRFGEVMRLGPGKSSYLTEKNLNYHVQVVGGSGAGKTNLLKLMIEDRIARGHGVIFFDFKADIELLDWMAGVCEAAGKSSELSIISMSDPKVSHSYNPLRNGNETEITSQLMNSLHWSESFYRDVAESGLMIIIKALCFRRDQLEKSFNIGDLYSFLTDASYRMDIVAQVHEYQYPERYRLDLRRVCEELSTNKKDNYQGLINQLSKVMNSSAGEILCADDQTAPEFSFKKAMSEGGISYLFMNSLRLKETASVVGKMMLQDLMKTVGQIYDERGYQKRPITLVIDEFASFATPDFGEFIEKARGAGIGIVVAYQSLQSLKSIGGDLMIKLNENTASKVVFQVQDSEDAQWFAGLLGTKKVEKETLQKEEGLFFDRETGMKSVREVEEYRVHPNVLKGLRLGEALLICSKVDAHFGVVRIYKANEYCGEYVRARRSLLRRHEKSSRLTDSSHAKREQSFSPQDFL